MPDRIVRVGILTSEPVNRLSWPAEVFYRRLINIVDDYGRFDGRADVLRASLYPLKLDRVSKRDVETWMRQCADMGLVTVYTVEDKQYIEVRKFDQRLRAKHSKWPPPLSFDSICQHVTSNAAETDTESIKSPSEISAELSASAPPSDVEIGLPTNNGKEFLVFKTKAQEWGASYPAVDIPQTLREIRQWLVDNPAKRKTFKGMTAFVNRWLSKEQNGRYG